MDLNEIENIESEHVGDSYFNYAKRALDSVQVWPPERCPICERDLRDDVPETLKKAAFYSHIINRVFAKFGTLAQFS